MTRTLSLTLPGWRTNTLTSCPRASARSTTRLPVLPLGSEYQDFHFMPLSGSRFRCLGLSGNNLTGLPRHSTFTGARRAEARRRAEAPTLRGDAVAWAPDRANVHRRETWHRVRLPEPEADAPNDFIGPFFGNKMTTVRNRPALHVFGYQRNHFGDACALRSFAAKGDDRNANLVSA